MYRFMSKHSSDHRVVFLSRSIVTPRHRCIIMYEVVHESSRKICHYQQNVPQHHYLLDALVLTLHNSFPFLASDSKTSTSEGKFELLFLFQSTR